jgi:hypothetical protein
MDSRRRHLPCLLSSRNLLGQVQGPPVPMACSSLGGHLYLDLSLRLEGNLIYHLPPARRVSLRA